MPDERQQLVERLDGDVEAIVRLLPAALRQLAEWAGGHPPKASGARPPEDDAESPAEVDEDDDAGSSTLVEAAVLAGGVDDESVLLGDLAWCARLGRKAVASIDGADVARSPLETASLDREYLAVLRWAVRRLRGDVDERADIFAMRRFGLQVGRARRLVESLQPRNRPKAEGCRLHAKVGDYEPVSKNHTASGLCSRCGRFKRHHDAEPTVEILRCWGRSIHPTRQMIERAEAIAKKKREQQRTKKRRKKRRARG